MLFKIQLSKTGIMYNSFVKNKSYFSLYVFHFKFKELNKFNSLDYYFDEVKDIHLKYFLKIRNYYLLMP